jgi:hypothetical protein
LIILSFFGCAYCTAIPKENGLIYFICGILITEIADFDGIEHLKRSGCLNDFLYDKTRVDDGMQEGRLCTPCKEIIAAADLSGDQIKLLKDINVLLKQVSIALNRNKNTVFQYGRAFC